MVFQLNLKYLRVKISNLLRVVVYSDIGIITTCDISKLSQISRADRRVKLRKAWKRNSLEE